MRILVVSWPAYGHLLPMLPLIRAAQRAGHDVLVSSGADLAEVAGNLGLATHVSGMTLAQTYAQLPTTGSLGALSPQDQAEIAARHFFGAGAVARATDLAAVVGDWRPDLIVHDTTELGGAAVAVRTGTPHVTHGYGPAVPGTSSLALTIGRTLAAAGHPDPIPEVLAAPYLDVCPPGLPHNEPLPWPDVRPIRPSSGEIPAGAALPAELRDLPHQDTVYVTLGTVTNRAPEVFRAVVDGLRPLGVNAVVTTGPDQDPAVLGDLPDFVRAVAYLPQALLLPTCRAVVSHGGAGTMLGALCHGLPQLCLPQGTDQPANGMALAASGAGLVLGPDQVDAAAITAAVADLLADGAIARTARRLGAEIAAMPAPGPVLSGLQNLVPSR